MKKIPVSRWLTLFVLFAFLFNACSTATPSPTATSTIEVTSTAIPTSTSIPIIPTPQPINHLERVCDEGWATTNDTSKLPGSLVYGADNGIFLFDISSSHTKHIFKDVRYFINFAISPGHDALSTIEYRFVGKSSKIDWQRIWVVSQDKETPIIFPETFDAYLQFIDSQTILLVNENAAEDNYVGNGTTDKFYVLSMNTDQFTAHSVFLPNFSLREHQFSGPNDNMDPPWTLYSPDLKYVAYPIQQDWDKNFILDIQNGTTIPFDWGVSGFFAPNPFWMPNSKALTIVTPRSEPHQNYFNIALDGQVTQLTRLEDVAKDGYDISDITNSSQWSPDSRYLAFPIYFGGNGGYYYGTVFILDAQTGNILDLCYSEVWPKMNGGFFWSPDSRYLATDVEGKTQIIDIENKMVYDLNTKNQLGGFIGWVNWQIP